jgi:hypothetical protein
MGWCIMVNIFGREPINKIMFVNPVTKKVLYKAYEFFTIDTMEDVCNKLMKAHDLIKVDINIFIIGELKRKYTKEKYGVLEKI